MKIRALIGLLAISIAFSCQNKKDGNNLPEAPEAPHIFKVEMDVKAETADDYALYYTHDNSTNFSENEVIWRGVKGGMQAEKISFDLPEDLLPTNIRVDFGIKKDAKDVTLEKFKISYMDKAIEAKGSEFLYYFAPNEKVDAVPDMAKGTITFRKKAEFPTETYFYYPNKALNDTIRVLTTGKK